MAKKPAKTKSRAKLQPEPAQLKAIERLLEDSDYSAAVRKIKPLVQRFPDHGGLRHSLVAALERSEGPRAAALAAYAWSERRPNSLPAQQALFHFAAQLDHPMLAEHTACKVRDLGGDTPGFPLDAAVKDALLEMPYGMRASAEDMTCFDIGKLHLDAQDFSGALTWFEGLDLLPARNNRALALFHLDRIDDALAAFMASWQVDPENLLALGWAVRLRLCRGDDTGARGLCTPLAGATARRVDDALPQLDGLLLLQENQPAWDAFQRATRSDWFEPGEDISDAVLRHYGACAASRLGKAADARRLWEEALEIEPDLYLASTNLDLFDRDGKAPAFPAVFAVDQALPITRVATLRAQIRDTTAPLDALAASNAYLEALYIGGDRTVRTLARAVLQHRATKTDAEALRLLKQFAGWPVGTKAERFEVLTFLRAQGFLGRDEQAEIWDGEKLRQVRVTSTEIYREADESDLPTDLLGQLGEAIDLINDGRHDEAEARLNAILQRVPGHRVALGNLAAVRSLQGRRDEALRLLRHAVAQHPDYLFARCNLAKLLIRDGEIDEAEELLEGLEHRERLHVQEVFALYGALAMLHTAKGDHEVAQSFITSLESLVEDEDDARRLADVRQSIDRRNALERFKEQLSSILKRGRNRHQR